MKFCRFLKVWSRLYCWIEEIKHWHPSSLLMEEPLSGSQDILRSLHPRTRRWGSSQGRWQSCWSCQIVCTWDLVLVGDHSPPQVPRGDQALHRLASHTWSGRKKETAPMSDQVLQLHTEWRRSTPQGSLQQKYYNMVTWLLNLNRV